MTSDQKLRDAVERAVGVLGADVPFRHVVNQTLHLVSLMLEYPDLDAAVFARRKQTGASARFCPRCEQWYGVAIDK